MHDRILILKPSSLGDIVQTLPALAALRRGRPDAHISWVVNSEWVSTLGYNSALDGIYVFPRHRFRGLKGALEFSRWLRREPPEWHMETVLDFQGLLRSGLIARATRAPQVVGLDDSREGARFFHREIVPTVGMEHSVERYLRLARSAGATDGPIEFPLRPGEPVPDFACPEERIIVLHPFARGRGKSLSSGDVGVFARAVHPHPVVVVGRDGIVDETWPGNVIDLVDKTSIPELIWLLRRAAAIVSVDSGPMHLAAAVGRPLIGIHAWTDPRKVGPYRADAVVWKGGAMCRFDELAHQSPDFFSRRYLPCADDVAAIARRALNLAGMG